ncbi:MAG: TraM recognition domain-containing protein, partial [Chloroflexota bacterium]
PLLNKLRAFLLSSPIRAIIGQEQTTFDLDQVLDGGLLLARLPKGSLGEETSRLLGALLISRVWQQVQARTRLPEHERRDCALYVDEMHNYLALPRSFEDLLAEARGYRLSLCLAHQHLAQLPREMSDALSANARTKLVFTCSPEDAHKLERHFAPELTGHDLANLDPHQAACRTLADGKETRPFTLRTQPLPDPNPDKAAKLREQSERQFGRAIGEVERQLRRRHIATRIRAATPARTGRRSRRRNRARSHDRATPEQQNAVQSRAFTPPGRIPDKEEETE